MPKPNKLADLPTKSDTATAEAREQAAEYGSIFAPTPLRLDNGDTLEIPPHPTFALLDDDRQAEYEELIFTAETEYDRAPDVFVPEQQIKDRAGNTITLPSITRKGNLLVPYRKTDEDGKVHLIKPPHSVQVVKTCIGEDAYNKLRAGGKSAADVWQIWNEQYRIFTERQNGGAGQAADLKSDGSTVDLAPVPEADSAGSAPVSPAEDS